MAQWLNVGQWKNFEAFFKMKSAYTLKMNPNSLWILFYVTLEDEDISQENEKCMYLHAAVCSNFQI